MQVGPTTNFGETEDITPFLSNTAFGAEMVGLGGVWATKRQARIEGARHSKYTRRARASWDKIDITNRNTFHSDMEAYSGIKERQRASKARARNLTSSSRRFSNVTKMMGWGTAVAFGIEVAGGIFNALHSYGSAERTRRQATSGSANDTQYYDTRVAATMRQRALQVIHNSQLSTRAAFGQEASYMHR